MNREEIIENIAKKIEDYIEKNFNDIKNNNSKAKETIEILVEMELRNYDL